MLSEEHVNEMMKGRRQKRFPRVLLCVTDNALRRETMLALTRQRFVVDECSVSSQVIPKWEHSAKYDLLVVYLDSAKDTNAPFIVSQLRRTETEPLKEREAVVHSEQQRRLGYAPPIPIDPHPVIARVKYANDQQVPKTFVLGCYNTVPERTVLEEVREDYTIIAKIPFSSAFLAELASWFIVPDPILPLSETPTVAQVLQFVQQANRTRLAQGHNRDRLNVNFASSTHQASAASIHYEHQLQVLKEDLAAAYAARDAAEEESAATNLRLQGVRAELEQARQQCDEHVAEVEAAQRLVQVKTELYTALETEHQQLLRLVADDSTSSERHSDLLHVVGQCKKLRDSVLELQSQLVLLQAEYTSLEKRYERLSKNPRRATQTSGQRVSMSYGGNDGFRPVERGLSVFEVVSTSKEESPHGRDVTTPFEDDEAASSSTSNPVQKVLSASNLGPSQRLRSSRSLRTLLRRESSIGSSVALVEPVMQPSLKTLERYENTIMSLHDDFGRLQLCNAMQAMSLRTAPQTAVNLGGTFLVPCGSVADDEGAGRRSVDDDLARQLMMMWNEVETSIRHAEHDLALMSAGLPSEVAASSGAARSVAPVADPLALAREKGLLKIGSTEADKELHDKLKALIDCSLGPVKEWMLQTHTGFRNLLHDLALDGMQQFTSDSKSLQRLAGANQPNNVGSQQQVLNHTAKYFQRNIRKAVKGFGEMQVRNHQRLGLTIRKSIEGMCHLLKPMLVDVRRAVSSGKMKSESEGGVQTEKTLSARRPSTGAAASSTPRRPTILHPSTYKTEI